MIFKYLEKIKKDNKYLEVYYLYKSRKEEDIKLLDNNKILIKLLKIKI